MKEDKGGRQFSTTGVCALWAFQQLFVSAPPPVLCLQWDPRNSDNCLAISVLLRRAWQVITHTSLSLFLDCIYKGPVGLPRSSWMESIARSAEETCSRSLLAPLSRLRARFFLLLVLMPGLKHQGNQNVCTVS